MKLELEQDLAFQYRQWQLERIGWAVMGLTIVAGLAGLFGHSPFTRAEVQSGDQKLTIQYDRFARYESNAEIKVSVEIDGAEEQVFRLWLDDDYLDTLKVLEIEPVPVRGEAREGSHAFVFKGHPDRTTVKLLVQFQSFGLITGTIKKDDGAQALLKHFVWP